MVKSEKNIIAFVMGVRERTISQIRAYEKDMGREFRIMIVRDSRTTPFKHIPAHDILVECDFSKPNKIAEALLPYEKELLAITCRLEQNIARFAQVVPHVPYLRTPTTESLRWSTDKHEMRKRLKLYNSKITPVFTRVTNATKKEQQRVIEKVGFPMVVKPASLAASLFVTICYHEEDLEQALKTTFRKLKVAYKKDGRLEEPKVIAEQYIEGDLYSIDSYIDSRGQIYHCPLVRQKTARDLGRDDFYNYFQMTPTVLKKETVERAHAVTEDAIHALGLRSITAHTELIKVDDEWKIVEVGPRPGGVRDLLYELSCDINHAMNDIAIRIPRKPVIPKKCKGYTVYLKYFAPKEGKIVETRGIKKIEDLESFHSITVNKRVGDRSVFAKNGGRAIFVAVLYNEVRSKLLADIRRIEKTVSVKVEARKNGTTKPASEKKVAKRAIAKKTATKKTG